MHQIIFVNQLHTGQIMSTLRALKMDDLIIYRKIKYCQKPLFKGARSHC